MEIYKEFQELFDGFMEEFCEAEGVDSTEFMQKMQESESSDPRAAHYISIIIASMEYDAFVKLMRQMRRRATVVEQQQQQRAEAKDGDMGGATAPRGGAKDGGAKGGAGGAVGAAAAEAKAEAKGDDGAKPGGVKDDDAPKAGGSAK